LALASTNEKDVIEKVRHYHNVLSGDIDRKLSVDDQSYDAEKHEIIVIGHHGAVHLLKIIAFKAHRHQPKMKNNYADHS
jgi:hypothetical protein